MMSDEDRGRALAMAVGFAMFRWIGLVDVMGHMRPRGTLDYLPNPPMPDPDADRSDPWVLGPLLLQDFVRWTCGDDDAGHRLAGEDGAALAACRSLLSGLFE